MRLGIGMLTRLPMKRVFSQRRELYAIRRAEDEVTFFKRHAERQQQQLQEAIATLRPAGRDPGPVFVLPENVCFGPCFLHLQIVEHQFRQFQIFPMIT